MESFPKNFVIVLFVAYWKMKEGEKLSKMKIVENFTIQKVAGKW